MKNKIKMSDFLLAHKEDLHEIVTDSLENFDDANLASKSAREAIAYTIIEGLKELGKDIDLDVINNRKN